MSSDRTNGAEGGVPVTFVAARPGRAGRIGFQEWRYRTTGRVVEVAETNAYAPSSDLQEGAEGFVEYRRGVPMVVRRPGDRLGRSSVPAPRSALRTPPSTRPRSGPARPRGAPVVWVLVGLLILVILMAWGR